MARSEVVVGRLEDGRLDPFQQDHRRNDEAQPNETDADTRMCSEELHGFSVPWRKTANALETSYAAYLVRCARSWN